MPNIEYGLLRSDTQHAIAVTETATSSTVQTGKRVAPGFELVVEQAPAILPSTVKLLAGIALNATDAVYVTTTEPATKLYSFGIATRTDGAVFITATYLAPMKEVFHPTIGFGLVDQRGALYATGGGITPESPDFSLPLADGGAGAVTLTLSAGIGSATFTRATAAACRLSTGLWKLDVASGVARAHYHEFSPGVMTYGGYLAEPAATQLAIAPRDMTNAAWAAVGMTVAQDGTGIDGVVNSCSRLTATVGGDTVLQTLVAAASSRTYSCFIKRVTGTGAITISQGATTLAVTASVNSTTFTQVQLPASVLNSAFGITLATIGDVILVDCNQFEAGGEASTPIPAAGTRNADKLTYPIAGNFLETVGTCYAEIGSLSGVAATRNLVTAEDGGGLVLYSTAVTNTAVFDGTNNISKASLTDFSTGIRKRASSWGAAGMALTGDGVAVSTSSFDGNMGGGSTTNIGIGCDPNSATSTLNGTIKNVWIWKLQGTNAQLQTITT